MLQVNGIHTFYDKSHILLGVSLHVNDAECVSLLGRNGAGKTTTLKSIIGLTPPRQGAIVFKGIAVHEKRPFEISRMGVGYVPQGRRIFGTLTVLENLTIGRRTSQKQPQWTEESVLEVFPRLKERKANRGSELSGGEQQMLTIARALMGNPELLLIDEPTEGLAPLIVQRVVNILGDLKKMGLPLLLVEQRIETTYALTDRYYILQQGTIIYKGTAEEFRGNEAVKRKFLGV